MDDVRFSKLEWNHPQHGPVIRVDCQTCGATVMYPRKELTPIAVAEWEAKHRRVNHGIRD